MSKRQESSDAGARKVRISLTSQDGQVLEAPYITDLAGVPRPLLAAVSTPEFVHVSWMFKRGEETLIYDIQRMVEYQITLFQQQPRDKTITATEVSGLFVLFTLNCGHTYRYAYRDHDLAVDVAALARDYACHCAQCDENAHVEREKTHDEAETKKKQ
ncbi:MAG TPA: hypothetical protein VJO32_12655 [Ktedonobacteraceae bacterium]|nr:hypothetical protein [Ktedonobacteraceae bacterium]